MATWQIKDFDEAPMMIGEHPCGYFAGSFFCDGDGEIVEIDVRVDLGPDAGTKIRLSEPAVISPVPNPFFLGLRAGLELVYRTELLALRNEIERQAEAAYRLSVA